MYIFSYYFDDDSVSVCRKGPVKRKGGNMLVASGKVKAVSNFRKEEMPHKLQILPGNSTKYMSYIKVTKLSYFL